MMRLSVGDAGLRSFLASLFAGANGQTWEVQVSEGEIASTVGNPLLVAMIERGNEGLPFAVPFTLGETDYWMLTGGDHLALERAAVRVGRSLVPSFACFSGSDRGASLQQFQPDRNAIQATGAARFPNGYYSFISPVERRRQVEQRLKQWTELEAGQPPPRDETPPTYAQLVRRFDAATAASQWGDAEAALDTLDRFNLCSADNLRFLQLTLLARQGRWSDLWQASDRRRIVELRMPRAVRAAMLQAFHSTILAPIECQEGVNAALRRYQTERPGLGGLLTGRYGLELPSVLITHGYEAVHSGDRGALAELEQRATESVRPLLRALAELLPPPDDAQVEPDGADERVRAALQLDDLDAAIVAADDVADPMRRLAARIEIAARSADTLLCAEVLGELELAGDSGIRGLLSGNTALVTQLLLVAQIAGKSHVTTSPPVDTLSTWGRVTDWFDWFESTATSAIDTAAHAALDRVEGSFERSFSDAWAAELSDTESGCRLPE